MIWAYRIPEMSKSVDEKATNASIFHPAWKSK
jgi:hypothetical protein